MKRTIIVLASFVALTAACQIESMNEPSAADGHAVFEASTEVFAPQTRTSMTPEKHVVWSENDRLAIFQGSTLADEYKVSDASAGKVNATFSIVTAGSSLNGDFSAGTEILCNVALYPYAQDLSLTGSVLEDEGEVYTIDGIVLPSEQTYVPGSFANGSFLMTAVTETMADHNLKFKNVLGAMKLSLEGTQTVKSIKVEGKNDEILSGSVLVSVYSDNSAPAIEMTATDDASKAVTLYCGDGVALNGSAVTDFIIALPPTEFTQGFIVTVTDSESQTYTIETDKANEVLRSSILAMPAVTLGEELNGDLKNYVDEYGINHGPGVQIGETVWAPVNCGYHTTDFPYGKLYQWGRKYGQGYSGALWDEDRNYLREVSDAETPELTAGPVFLNEGQSEDNAAKFYYHSSGTYDWLVTQNNALWNAGTEDEPIKTVYDPCPIGWRVPTYDELDALSENHSSCTINGAGQTGYWFSGRSAYSEDAPQVFFPAAGGFGSTGDDTDRGYAGNYWSSSAQNNTQTYYLLFYGSNVRLNWGIRVPAYSVRCVQDNGDGDGVPVDHIDISLDMSELTLMPGYSYALVPEVISVTNTVDDIVWTSSDPSVAEVSSGTVVARSDGNAVITASIGSSRATCSVTVKTAPSVTVKNYVVDGVDYGLGINIGGTVWAPVNCGYEPASGDYKGYPYGKLYQWGRKYGQGYDESDASYPSGENLVAGPVSLDEGLSEDNADKFFVIESSPLDWCLIKTDDLWVDSDGKTSNDPCPDGWRVPTIDELHSLFLNYSSWTTNDEGQNGYYFVGEYTYREDIPQVFFPAAGYRDPRNNVASRDWGLYWSSTPFWNDTYLLELNMYGDAYVRSINRGFGASVRCVQE